jgi:hypothetical protein
MPRPASFTLAFALQLRKTTEKPQSGWPKKKNIIYLIFVSIVFIL